MKAGEAGPGAARRGEARHGTAWHGKAGMERHGLARNSKANQRNSKALRGLFYWVRFGMSNIRCSYCGGAHAVSLCPKTWSGSSNRKNLYCTYCGSNTHKAEFCLKTFSGASNRRAKPSGDFLD